jgi:hypothetical protein
MASFIEGNPATKGLYGDLKRRMDGTVATFQANLASTRTGRASVHMLDQIKVEYYGTHMPINQLAQVSTPEAQLILISPFDPTIVKEIEKALQGADLGPEPAVGWQGDPHSCSANDRGAAARCGEAFEARAGRASDGGAQCAARRQRCFGLVWRGPGWRGTGRLRLRRWRLLLWGRRRRRCWF